MEIVGEERQGSIASRGAGGLHMGTPGKPELAALSSSVAILFVPKAERPLMYFRLSVLVPCSKLTRLDDY